MISAAFTSEADEYKKLRADMLLKSRNVLANNIAYTTVPRGSIFDAFLLGLPEYARQHYTCHACRDFINKYGGLVYFASNSGDSIEGVIWPEPPPFFAQAVNSAKSAIASEISGVFVSSKHVLGTPESNGWSHFCSINTQTFAHPTKSASQAVAEYKEDFKSITYALARYNMETTERAIDLVTTNSVHRSEHILPALKWFLAVHQSQNHAAATVRNNRLWRMIATAPAGFAHIANSPAGVIMSDIADGKRESHIVKRAAEIMNPNQYRRPSAPVSSGAIAEGNRLAEKLDLGPSLQRRQAAKSELRYIWTPRPYKQTFSSRTENDKVMTWTRFQREILPIAVKIEAYVPAGKPHMIALTTAETFHAPPILQWDNEKLRNPVAWYVHSNPNDRAWFWGLNQNTYVEVTGITLKPNLWQPGFEHHGKGAIAVLAQANDTLQVGSAIFPEFLKSHLKPLEKLIERENQLRQLGRVKDPACGLIIQDRVAVRLRAHTKYSIMVCNIDRWD